MLLFTAKIQKVDKLEVSKIGIFGRDGMQFCWCAETTLFRERNSRCRNKHD